MEPYTVLDRVQLTEKGAMLAEGENQYFFKVHPDANKHQIKEAVETIFKVGVKNVRTMNYQGKLKGTRTRTPGRRSDWKRAVVTLNDGDKIDLI